MKKKIIVQNNTNEFKMVSFLFKINAEQATRQNVIKTIPRLVFSRTSTFTIKRKEIPDNALYLDIYMNNLLNNNPQKIENIALTTPLPKQTQTVKLSDALAVTLG